MVKKSCRCVRMFPVLLCGLAACAVISAAETSLKGDDELNLKNSGAVALLHIPLPERIGALAGQNVQAEYEIFKNTQMMMLQNRIVLQNALHRQGIGELAIVKSQKDPAAWLDKNLKVSSIPKTEIVEVGLTSGNAKENAMLVNAVVDAYFSEVVDAARKRIDDRISDLKRIQIEKSQEVKESMNELRRMAESLGTNDSDTLNIQQKNALDELANMRAEFIRSQFELNRMRAESAANQAELEATDMEAISDIECELYVPSDFTLKSLQQEIVQAKKDNDQKLTAELKEKYSSRLEEIRREIHRKKIAEIEKKVKRLEAQIAVATKQSEVLVEEVKKLRKEADRFGVSSIDMQMRRGDIKSRQKSLDSITAELEALRVEANAGPRVTILQKAEVPE
jgi:polysaccharide biosynthesis transport protein